MAPTPHSPRICPEAQGAAGRAGAWPPGRRETRAAPGSNLPTGASPANLSSHTCWDTDVGQSPRAAWPGLTFAGAAVGRQPEARGAAAVEGAQRVLALVAAQAPGVAPALVDVCNAAGGAQGSASPPCPSAPFSEEGQSDLSPEQGRSAGSQGHTGLPTPPTGPIPWAPCSFQDDASRCVPAPEFSAPEPRGRVQGL